MHECTHTTQMLQCLRQLVLGFLMSLLSGTFNDVRLVYVLCWRNGICRRLSDILYAHYILHRQSGCSMMTIFAQRQLGSWIWLHRWRAFIMNNGLPELVAWWQEHWALKCWFHNTCIIPRTCLPDLNVLYWHGINIKGYAITYIGAISPRDLSYFTGI